MTKRLRIVLGIILLLGIAAGSYFWATGMIDSNYSYRSPLKNNPPAPGETLGEASTQRVVLLLIDALRYDTSLNKDVMPTLNRLRAQGASSEMHSRPPSFSEPGYSSLLTGAWPELSDGPTINLAYEDIPTWTQDNLFSAAHRAGLKTAVSGYYWFEKLIPQNAVDYRFYTPGEDRNADEDVMKAALPWLENGNAQLVLIHLDQVDFAGHHEGGVISSNWNEAANRTDKQLAEIVSRLDISKDTLIVFSDHGQIDAGGHGGQDPVTLIEPLVMVGAGIKSGDFGNVNMVDLAPTVSALLGLNLPASTQGQVLVKMLNLSDSVLAALPKAVQAQQTALLTNYASSIGANLAKDKIPTGSDVSQYQKVLESLRNNRLFGERIPRAAVCAVILSMMVVLWIRNLKNGSLWWIAGGLLVVGLFNYRYAIWDQKTYSLSSVTGQMDLIVYVATTTAIVLLIAWLIAALGRRTFWLKPADCALSTLGFVLTAVGIAGLPVLWSFFLNGVLTTWALPDYLSMFLALLGLIQVLVMAAEGTLLIGISALISNAALKKKTTKK